MVLVLLEIIAATAATQLRRAEEGKVVARLVPRNLRRAARITAEYILFSSEGVHSIDAQARPAVKQAINNLAAYMEGHVRALMRAAKGGEPRCRMHGQGLGSAIYGLDKARGGKAPAFLQEGSHEALDARVRGAMGTNENKGRGQMRA